MGTSKVTNKNLKSSISIEVSEFNPAQRKPAEPKIEYKDQYLTFKALENCKFTFTYEIMSYGGSISYSVNNGKTWSTIQLIDTGDYHQTINTSYISKGKTILWKGDLHKISVNPNAHINFSSTGKFDVYGNILSLICEDNFKNQISLPENINSNVLGKIFYNAENLINAKNLILPLYNLSSWCYNSMFYGCTSLKTAPKLPATTLTYGCYNSMFYGCTSLVTPPELPATILAEDCYYSMFDGCTSLKTAPKLPATTLEFGCYYSMFNRCTSLTTAPELPATSLSNGCYRYMFYRCSSLKVAPELPATTLAVGCYFGMFQGCTSLTTAPELPATTLADDCYLEMFRDCTSLINIPSILPATILKSGCYESMFQNCILITTAPELPAITRTNDCYFQMFYNCSNLNYIKAMFTTWSGIDASYKWVYGVSTTGTFVKNINANWNHTGVDAIPQGWTIETASE